LQETQTYRLQLQSRIFGRRAELLRDGSSPPVPGEYTVFLHPRDVVNFGLRQQIHAAVSERMAKHQHMEDAVVPRLPLEMSPGTWDVKHCEDLAITQPHFDKDFVSPADIKIMLAGRLYRSRRWIARPILTI
jgi:hypothetical protein